MRLFVQLFYGEVQKWFKDLTVGSIHDFQEFELFSLESGKERRPPCSF
jgi:hypothetical protein